MLSQEPAAVSRQFSPPRGQSASTCPSEQKQVEKDGSFLRDTEKRSTRTPRKIRTRRNPSLKGSGASLAAILVGCPLSLRFLTSRPPPLKEWHVFLWSVFWEQRAAIRLSTLRKDGASCSSQVKPIPDVWPQRPPSPLPLPPPPYPSLHAAKRMPQIPSSPPSSRWAYSGAQVPNSRDSLCALHEK